MPPIEWGQNQNPIVKQISPNENISVFFSVNFQTLFGKCTRT